MKRLISKLRHWLGPRSGYPILSGLASGALILVGVFFSIWAFAWIVHFAAEFFTWLPWPKAD